jgi:serine/threonine protein kinase/tetratricopeptide (TPR) repeat protein
MNSKERKERIYQLFDEVVELSESERASYLNQVCGQDPSEIRAAVERLLEADQAARLDTEFLDPGVFNFERLASTEPQDPLIGQQIGHYLVKKLLGGGGFGNVYVSVRRDDYEQKVAIKVLRPEHMFEEPVLARFELERQVVADFQHENICRLLDGGSTTDKRPYFVMEYIDGQSITEYCEKNNLNVTERLKKFQEVCRAVAYAHRFEVIHRDIKPSNILVTREGIPKLLDFGIAKLVDPRSERRMITLSQAGQPFTPEYASPEQVRGETVSTQTDVYSLGVLLYKLLTDRLPYAFPSGLRRDIERVICEEEPRKPSTVVTQSAKVLETDGSSVRKRPQSVPVAGKSDPKRLGRLLSGDLDNIVLMALRKEPRARYESPTDFAEDIQKYLEGRPVRARRITPVSRAFRWCKRNPMAAALVIVVLVVAVVASLTSAYLGRLVSEKSSALEAKDIALTQAAEQRKRADANFVKAQNVVNDFLVEVSDSQELLRGSPGTQALRRRLLEMARDYFLGFVQQDPSSHLQSHLARAQLRLGVAEYQLGNVDNAEQSYRKGTGIYERLVKTNPTVLEYWNDLAKSYGNLGVFYGAMGDHDAAADQYQKVIEIVERLAKEHPGVSEYQIDLVRSHNNLGIVYRRTADLRAGAEQFQKAIEIGERLVKANPAVPMYQSVLATSYNNLAIVCDARDDHDAAAEQCQKAIEIGESLVKANPTVPEYQDVLVGSYTQLGVFYRRTGDHGAAAEQYQKAIEIGERLVKANPTVPEYKNVLAMSYNNLGIVSDASGDHDAAAEQFAKAIEIRESLVKANPTVPEYQGELAKNYNNLGIRHSTMHDHDAAAEQFAKAIEIGESLVKANPTVPDYQSVLMGSYSGLGIICDETDDGGPHAYDLLIGEHYRDLRRIGQVSSLRFPVVPKLMKSLVDRLGHLCGRHFVGPP